jgi:hypothetical protein
LGCRRIPSNRQLRIFGERGTRRLSLRCRLALPRHRHRTEARSDAGARGRSVTRGLPNTNILYELPRTRPERSLAEAPESDRTRPPCKSGRCFGCSQTLKQRQTYRSEVAFQTQRDLGYPVRLQIFSRTRELALFGLGIDSKLRACDWLKLKVRDVCHGACVGARAIVVQQKTSRPVRFEITEPTRAALTDWIRLSALAPDDLLFRIRVHKRGPESWDRTPARARAIEGQ